MACAQCGRPLFDFEHKDGVCMTCPLMEALALRDRAELARYGAQRWDRRFVKILSKNADRPRVEYAAIRATRKHNV